MWPQEYSLLSNEECLYQKKPIWAWGHWWMTSAPLSELCPLTPIHFLALFCNNNRPLRPVWQTVHGEPLVCFTVRVYATLHISSLKLQQAESSFQKLLSASWPKSYSPTGVLLCTVSKKWVWKVKELVEIVSESHILNSQWLVKACPVFSRTQDMKEFPSVNVLNMFFFLESQIHKQTT